MIRLLKRLGTALCSGLLLCESASAVTLPFQNLGLDVPGFPDQPRAWSTSDPAAVMLDRVVKQAGAASTRVDATNAPQQLWTQWDAQPWRSQTLEITGWTKLNLGKGSAGAIGAYICTALACSPGKEVVFNTAHDWTTFTLKLKIPADATFLQLGVQLPSGVLWLDSLSLRVNGQPVTEQPPFLGPDHDQLAWLKEQATPVRTEAADHNDADLAAFGALVGDARIVGLGEGTHGTHEFFTLKTRLVQVLVEQKGFRIFALEGSAAQADRVNRYLQTGQGQPESLLGAPSVWNTAEVMDLLRWMRRYNTTAKEKLLFTGFDLGNTSNLAELSTLQELTARAEPAYSDNLVKLLVQLSRDGYSTYGPVNPQRAADYQSTRALAATVLLHFQHQEVRYRKILSAQEEQTLLQYATRVWQFTGMPIYGPNEYRDRMMARNLEAVARDYPGQKIVAWAHDIHLGRLPGRMGEVLTQDFGPAYLPIGTLFGAGTYTAQHSLMQPLVEGNVAPPMYPGSVEEAFSQVGGPFFLKLRNTATVPAAGWLNRVQDMRIDIGTVAYPHKVTQANLARVFDGIFFVPESTSSRLIP